MATSMKLTLTAEEVEALEDAIEFRALSWSQLDLDEGRVTREQVAALEAAAYKLGMEVNDAGRVDVIDL